MKILLRDKCQERYLGQRDSWVTDVGEARDFRQGKDAISHAILRGFAGVDLLYVFSDSKYNFALPLPPTPPPLAGKPHRD